MTRLRFELWFDFSCPYAYLASRCADRLPVDIDWRPMLLGGVFRGIGAGAGPMATISPAKAAHNLDDMYRWADTLGVPFAMPPAHPMRTVRALRTLLGLPGEDWPVAIAAIYRAYWEHGEDITDAAVIARALGDAGIAAARVEAALVGADSEPIKAALRDRTDEAIALGIFGAPAWVVRQPGAEPLLVWGQDRLPWLAAIADGWRPDDGPPPGGARPLIAPPPAVTATARRPRLDVYFDVASPFAYLALTQLPALAAHAELRLVPILLGALFRDLGTANVPLFTMPPPKLRYVTREMARWARWWGVPFDAPTKFPQRTVTAQRLAILASEQDPAAGLALATALGRAMWAEQRDLDDPDTLRSILDAHGLPRAWLAATQDPRVKAQLAANTERARRSGVFGVPTFVIDERFLFWGQDRLDLVARALAGWVPPREAAR